MVTIVLVNLRFIHNRHVTSRVGDTGGGAATAFGVADNANTAAGAVVVVPL